MQSGHRTKPLALRDELEADRVAVSPAFESDPVALFDLLVDRLGAERASAIWARACDLYDRRHEARP